MKRPEGVCFLSPTRHSGLIHYDQIVYMYYRLCWDPLAAYWRGPRRLGPPHGASHGIRTSMVVRHLTHTFDFSNLELTNAFGSVVGTRYQVNNSVTSRLMPYMVYAYRQTMLSRTLVYRCIGFPASFLPGPASPMPSVASLSRLLLRRLYCSELGLWFWLWGRALLDICVAFLHQYLEKRSIHRRTSLYHTCVDTLM